MGYRERPDLVNVLGIDLTREQADEYDRLDRQGRLSTGDIFEELGLGAAFRAYQAERDKGSTAGDSSSPTTKAAALESIDSNHSKTAAGVEESEVRPDPDFTGLTATGRLLADEPKPAHIPTKGDIAYGPKNGHKHER